MDEIPKTALSPDRKKIRTIETATLLDQRYIEEKKWLTRKLMKYRRQFLRYYFIRPPRWRVVFRSKFNNQRMAPDFACWGPVRSGTTSLSDYIMQHPCVVLPLAKEIMITPKKLLWLAQFPTLKQKERIQKKYGAAHTGLFCPAVPDLRMPYFAKSISDSLKFVIILRNPVDRTFAHWRWDQVKNSRFKDDPLWECIPDFSGIVRLELEAIQSKGCCWPTASGMRTSYLQHSIYLPFIRILFRLFDRKNVFLIDSAAYFLDPFSTAKEIYSFLRLPDYNPIKLSVKNAGPAGKMDDSTRELLCEFFEPINKQLYDFIDQDFNWH